MYSDTVCSLVREGYAVVREFIAVFERFTQAHERLANAYDRAIPQYTWTVPGVVHVPADSIPQVPWPPNTTPLEPYRPLIGDPPGWPNNPTVICGGQTNSASTRSTAYNNTAMPQADGMGDDSGLRGD